MSAPHNSEHDIKSVEILTVLQWDTARVNLYVQLANGRYLVVLRKGNPVDRDRLQKYLTKGVKTLFASDRDLANEDFSESKPVDPKVQALEKVSDAVFEDLRALGITEASFQNAKIIGKALRGMIEKDVSLSATFEKFQSLSREEVRHSMMVSALATVIASSMEWSKRSTIESIAMGGLLHDFGKLTIPLEILNVDPLSLSANDRKILEGHAENGRLLLAQVKTIPEDIQMIVGHHHERSDGSGYPFGLKDIYIHPLARVVGLANELVDRYENDVQAGRETSIHSLVETLIVSQPTKFNRELIKSLRDMLRTES